MIAVAFRQCSGAVVNAIAGDQNRGNAIVNKKTPEAQPHGAPWFPCLAENPVDRKEATGL